MRLAIIRSLACPAFLTATISLHPQTTTSHTPPGAPAWHTLYEENFEGPVPFSKAAPAWTPDTHQLDDEYSDGGAFFQKQNVKPPTAFRIEVPFSQDNWLTAAAYTRSDKTAFSDLFAVVPDPANPANPSPNHVLRLASPKSTDGLVIRPTAQLPAIYRVCVRAGYASFGDGKPGPASLNGYPKIESAGPWVDDQSNSENGFYWLTILDATPRPHNNVWIHHHRKVVIDSDNNRDAWTNIWEGRSWVADGRHPIMMFGIDKTSDDHALTGRDFLSWSNGALQPSGEIRAVDAYKDSTWYTACIARDPENFTLSISGDFKFGGQQTYTATIPVSATYATAPTIPDFFMFGDPHNNYYRGSIYYDDIKLETPAAETSPSK